MNTPGVDLDMLAYDIADLFDRNEYPIDASQDDIRPHLPAFLATVQATVDQRPDDA